MDEDDELDTLDNSIDEAPQAESGGDVQGDGGTSVGQDYENTEQKALQGMKKTAQTAGNLARTGAGYAKKLYDKANGPKLRDLKALRKARAVKREISEGTKTIKKGVSNIGRGKAKKKAGENLKKQGEAVKAAAAGLSATGVGAIAGAALNKIGNSMIESGAKKESSGAEAVKLGKQQVVQGRNRIFDAPKAEPEEKGSSSDNNQDVAPDDTKVPNAGRVIKDTIKKALSNFGNLIKIFLKKYWWVILIPILILILIVIFTASSKKDRGKYKEGDNSNVPYVVQSQIMANIIVVDDGNGGFTYGVKDEEGNILNLDEAIDKALKTLAENGASSSLEDLGKNEKQRKETMRNMLEAEIATQYPDLTASSSTVSAGGNTQSNVTSTNAGTVNTTAVTVDDLTLDEKIYQMIMLGVSVSNASSYSNSQVGGFFLFGGSNYENLGAMGSSNKVAPFVATDDEGGQITRAAQNTKSAKYYGDSQNYDQLKADEITKSNYLLSKGINLNLSPVADVSSSGTMYTLERSYSSDPEVVKQCIKTVIEARASANVDGTTLSSTLKHYPGYPDNTTNTDNGIVKDNRSSAEINKNINVFKSGISYGAQSVMMSNVIYTNLDASNPASLSPTIISDLRNGFSGVIMTDDLDAVATKSYTNRYKDAIKAGNDIILLDEGNLNTAFNQIKDAVSSGEIPETQINESVERILSWKASTGVGNVSGSSSGSLNSGGNTGTLEVSSDFKSDINGKIKIQRKNDDGSVSELTYINTQAFNSLLSAKDPSVMNYYTLKTGGATSGTSVSGVKLEGSDAATQIWNFLINDMGYSEAVAAGLMGNMMRECGGDTLNLQPTAQNSYGNGHYGIIQWDMVYCREVVGQDLAGQLEFFSRWIQSGEFDAYANNYRAGFSYSEFLNMTDPGEAAAAFGTVMERFGATYATIGMTDEYVTRANNARNAYATLAGTTASSNSLSQVNNTSSNSNTSNRNSSSGSSTSNGVTLTSNGNIEFLDCAVAAHKLLNDEGFVYSCSGRSMPVNSGDALHTVDCAVYVSMALEWYGRTDWNEYPWQLTDRSLVTYGNEKLEKVFEGSASNISEIPGIESGDIVVMDGHTQIFYGYNSSGVAVWLNCGSNDSITCDEGTDAYSSLWKPIKYVYRVPGGSGTGRSGSQNNTNSNSNLTLVVANRKDVTTTVVESYNYAYTYAVDKNSGAHLNGYSKTYASPESRQTSNTTTTTYTANTVDYQSALSDYTLYYDFLWAVLVESSGNRSLINKWAELAKDSNIMISVFTDRSTTTTTTSRDAGIYTHTEQNAGSSVAIYDAYNINETTTVNTLTITSKPAVTYADTWLLEYTNDANTYSEYKSRVNETKLEKLDPDSSKNNIIKILQNDTFVLDELYKGEYLVEAMLEDNSKVSFMIDIYNYILTVAKRGSTDVTIEDLVDIKAFDLTSYVRRSTGNGGVGGDTRDSSGDGYTTTFTTGNMTFNEYKQVDGSYAGRLIPVYNVTVAKAGCYITSVAVISSGYGHDMDPGDVIDYYNQNGYGYNHADALGSILGKHCYWQESNVADTIISQLQAGVPCMVESRYYSSNHCLCILAINDNNEVYLSDVGGNYYGSDRNGWQPIENVINRFYGVMVIE